MTALLLFTIAAFSRFNSYNSLFITKTATLKPNTINLEDNGATIIELDVITKSAPLEWQLYNGHTNQGFHLQLSLNTEWAFHPIQNTTLTIEVNASGNTGVETPDNNLMVAFTQNNPFKYFTTRIIINMDTDHGVYPPCHHVPPYTQRYIDADVTTLVNAYGTGNSSGKSQYYKAVYGYTDYDYYPWISPISRHVEPPLTFILLNNPQDNITIFTYTNPGTINRSCGFGETMNPNKGMDIYFAADSIWSSVDIVSITITRSYETTDAPTADPTLHPINPTGSPSMTSDTPSYSPSSNPSKYPSVNPTGYPSMNPSIIPTVTTNAPSISPSNNPTNNPTKPESVVDDTTTTLLSNDDASVGSDHVNNNSNMYIAIGSVSAAVVIVIIMIVVIIIICKRSKSTAITNQLQLFKHSKDHDTKLETPITEMATNCNIDNDRADNDNQDEDDLGNEVKSTSIRIYNQNAQFIDNAKQINIDEEFEGDNQDTEDMYDVVKHNETAGFEMVTDKGDSDKHEQVTSGVLTPTTDDGGALSGNGVNQWLRITVELPQYYDMFVENGLDSLQLIKKLNDNDQGLIDIGIESQRDRIKIMKYIKEMSIEEGNV